MTDNRSEAAAAFRRARSEAWLRDFAEQSGMTYEHLLDAVAECIEHGGYTFGDDDPADMYRSDPATFWRHYETATDTTVDDWENLGFRCAC